MQVTFLFKKNVTHLVFGRYVKKYGMNEHFKFIMVIGLLLSSCEKDCSVFPKCINDLIQVQKDDISAVYSYTYQGETVYEFTPQEVCCDFTNSIYSNNCEVICMLNGLIGNQICRGDTFYARATDKTLIWKK